MASKELEERLLRSSIRQKILNGVKRRQDELAGIPPPPRELNPKRPIKSIPIPKKKSYQMNQEQNLSM
jgi:hypothetical protein